MPAQRLEVVFPSTAPSYRSGPIQCHLKCSFVSENWIFESDNSYPDERLLISAHLDCREDRPRLDAVSKDDAFKSHASPSSSPFLTLTPDATRFAYAAWSMVVVRSSLQTHDAEAFRKLRLVQGRIQDQLMRPSRDRSYPPSLE
jgi:hypothetical protein